MPDDAKAARAWEMYAYYSGASAPKGIDRGVDQFITNYLQDDLYGGGMTAHDFSHTFAEGFRIGKGDLMEEHNYLRFVRISAGVYPPEVVVYDEPPQPVRPLATISTNRFDDKWEARTQLAIDVAVASAEQEGTLLSPEGRKAIITKYEGMQHKEAEDIRAARKELEEPVKVVREATELEQSKAVEDNSSVFLMVGVAAGVAIAMTN